MTTTVFISTASFQGNLRKLVPYCQTILDFAAARHGGGSSDDRCQATCEAPVSAPPPTCQHSKFFFFRPDALHATQPTVL